MNADLTTSNAPALVFSTSRPDGLAGYLNPTRFAVDLFRRRQLLWQFTIREVQGRYRGSFLGLFWALFNPLLTLAVYTLVFVGVFDAHWYGEDSRWFYAFNMFSGIVAYNVFSESVTKAATLITANPNYVKKVVFPLELLPASLVGSSLIHSLLSLIIILICAVATFGHPHWTTLYLPLVYVPLLLFTLGMTWLLACLGVFLRDLSNLVAVVVQLLFFASPITYPMSKVPLVIRPFMWLNPLAAMIESFRRVVNDGTAPDWSSLGIVTAISLATAVIGYAFFMKMKRAFADVI